MRIAFTFLVASSLAIILAGCSPSGSTAAGKVIKSAPAGNNLTIEISTPDGVLKHGEQQFVVAFKNADGKPVDVGSASLSFFMPTMGTMAAMTDQATLTTTATPGVYNAKANIEVMGEWQAKFAYEGPAGKNQSSFSITAQ